MIHNITRGCLFLLWLVAIALDTKSSYAADRTRAKLGPIKVNPADVFQKTDAKGKPVSCYAQKGKYVSGTLKGVKFTTGKVAIAKLAQKVGLASGGKAKKLKTQLKNLKKATKAKDALCAGGPGSDLPPNQNPPPPPSNANCDSMARYAGAFGEQQATDLLERFGFGVGPAEARLIDIAKTQGLDAFVAAAVTAVTEDQGVLEAVDSLAASDPANTTNDAILYHEILTKNPVHLRVTESLHGMITTGRSVLPADGQSLWYDHYKILRNAALQNKTFPQLVKESAVSPMMLYYLDNKDSTRNKPNENYARELQELFTLGVLCPGGGNNYTETRPSGDILNAARALTGWVVQRSGNTYVSNFVPALHETNAQVMYAGQAHSFTASTLDGLVDNIFARHPCAGYFQSEQMLKDFISEDPSLTLVRNFGDVIRQNGFRVMDSMATLMKSEAAFCPSYRDTVTKKPDRQIAEFVRAMNLINAVKSDPAEYSETLAQGTERSGFIIDLPPTVFYYKPQDFRTTASQLEFMNSAGAVVDIALNVGDALYPIANAFPAQANATSVDVVNHIAKKLNINPSDAQKLKLTNYLDTFVDPNTNVARRQVFVNNAANQRRKAAIWLIMSLLPQFSLS